MESYLEPRSERSPILIKICFLSVLTLTVGGRALEVRINYNYTLQEL